jgi:RNA polymerase sigma-32 factor
MLRLARVSLRAFAGLTECVPRFLAAFAWHLSCSRPASMRGYRSAGSSVAPLDRDTERELTRRWRAGDQRAGDSLVVGCLPFVVAIALEYRCWGVPIDDVVQQGTVGLLRAAAKFDLEKDCRLATYAAYWIRAEIRDYVVRAFRVVRLGTTKAEKRALRTYRRTGEGDPAALAAASGMTREKAEWLLPVLAGCESSLDAGTHDHVGMLDRLAGPSPSPEDEATAQERHLRASDAVNRALCDLSDRERLIVRERLMADEPRTLQELGATLGVSKERVRQIEERARGKLRSKLEGLGGEMTC